MNTKIRTAGIVAAVVVLGYPIASWVIGLAVERQLQRAEQQSLEQVPYITVISRNYRGGIFSATDDVTFAVGGPFAQAAKAAPGRSFLSDFRLTTHNVIHHGPLPGFRTVAFATVDSQLVLPSEVKARLDALLNGRPVLSVHSRMHWFGGSTSQLTSPAFQTEVAPGITLVSQGITGTAELSGNGDGTVDFIAKGFSASSQKGGAELGEIRLTGATHRAFVTLNIGKTHLTIDQADVHAPAPAPPIALRHLELNSDTSATGDHVDTQGSLSIASLQAGKFAATQLGYSVAATHLYGPALAALTADLRQAGRSMGTPAGSARTPASEQPWVSAFQKDGIEILLHDPVVEISRIGFLTPDGELRLSAKFTAPGLKREDFAKPGPAAMVAIVPHLQAAADLRVDVALLEKLLEDNANRERFLAQEEAFERQGYIVRDGKALTAHVEFAAGKLSINGKPFSPGQPGPSGPPAPR